MKKTNVIMNIRSVILSAPSVILSAAKNLFLLAVIAGLTGNLLASCDKLEDAVSHGGFQPDEEQLESPLCISFRTENTVERTVKSAVQRGESLNIALQIIPNQELKVSELVTISVDETLVSGKRLLPKSFYSFDDGGIIILPSGKQSTGSINLTISTISATGEYLESGIYCLPIVANTAAQSIVDNTLMIELNVLDITFDRPALYSGEDCFTVFYLNTSQFDPRLVTDFVVAKMNSMFEPIWENAIGHILNLRTVTVDWDENSKRAVLNLGPDMRYLCDHYELYLKPIQDTGRKLCICIEGGNKGIGFSNMSEAQISDFVSQIKHIIEQYGFDGVNLWDKNSGYGKDGMPPMNTTSYPILIKKLREELGTNKLITIADYAEPTEYFWDTEATGGIEVGQYLDYAWSGYVNGNEPIQIIDPYHQGSEFVSTRYPRKPIAGLSPNKYGCVHTTWYRWEDCGYDAVSRWVENGFRQNSISVYYDIRSNLQDKYEGQIYTPQELLQYLEANTYTYMFAIKNFRTEGSGYGKWLKEW